MIDWQIQRLQMKDLKAYDKNPRILTEKHQRLLSDSLGKFGMVEKPIVNADYTIIGGHQRVEVMALKGATEINCWVPHRELNEKEVEELNIVLNRVGGEWDYDILANEWDIGDLLTWGFEEIDLGLDKPEKPKKEPKPVISLEFSDKDTMLEHLQKCEEIAQTSSAKMKVRG